MFVRSSSVRGNRKLKISLRVSAGFKIYGILVCRANIFMYTPPCICNWLSIFLLTLFAIKRFFQLSDFIRPDFAVLSVQNWNGLQSLLPPSTSLVFCCSLGPNRNLILKQFSVIFLSIAMDLTGCRAIAIVVIFDSNVKIWNRWLTFDQPPKRHDNFWCYNFWHYV